MEVDRGDGTLLLPIVTIGKGSGHLNFAGGVARSKEPRMACDVEDDCIDWESGGVLRLALSLMRFAPISAVSSIFFREFGTSAREQAISLSVTVAYHRGR